MKISRRSLVAGLGLAPAGMGRIAWAEAAPAQAAPAFTGARDLDQVIEDAIRHEEIPGAVVLIGHAGRIVYAKAYGHRALVPRPEPMTLDTIFDAASLTKVVATTSAILKLFETGEVRLNDLVTRYLPEFQGGKTEITVRDLMTHFSGLRPDLDLEPAWSGYETGIRRALEEKSTVPPRVRFIYSDINFILLAEIVRCVAGEPLPGFAAREIFKPLGMTQTMFRPPAALRRRIAPTEIVKGELLRGVVHDTTTRYMGGIAGHAGLFTTAADLARFASMMLGEGTLGGVRVLDALSVRKATTPQSPPDQPILRGLGWDIDSPYSGNRGELFPIGSYGHTGFTGTSLWIDPVSKTFVILLSNSVHPKPRPAITPLRAKVATVVAAACGIAAPGIAITGYNETISGAGLHRVVGRNGKVLAGIDVLAAQNFAPLLGMRVGLVTNHSGLTRSGRRNVDAMREAGVNVVALFSPEHGMSGSEDRPDVPDSTDARTGLPVWSLHSAKTKRPTPEMMRGIEALVYDIQDVGARFYTYVTTMGYALEEAALRRIPFFVLDRPNPITGTHVEGPVLDADLESFVGYFPLPLRHGMTIGELAQLFNDRKAIHADLRVICMQDWQRGDWFDSTGLAWTDPSPNIRSLNAALLYPGIAMIEYSTNYSVGRGTDAPFEQVGAGWICGPDLAAYLNSRYIPGVRVYPTRFRPAASRFAGEAIDGIRVVITAREAFDSSRLGLEVAAALGKLYPGKIAFEDSRLLIGSRRVIEMLRAGEDPKAIQRDQEDSLAEFLKMRGKAQLYR
jgi:uncharacterized protein YbbC (DUF1343 family)/CubicO group peptidase (beta-lactamase class C family)